MPVTRGNMTALTARNDSGGSAAVAGHDPGEDRARHVMVKPANRDNVLRRVCRDNRASGNHLTRGALGPTTKPGGLMRH